MLTSPAYAQGVGSAGGFDLLSLAPLVLIFVVFYFLLIRPQQKKQKQHRAMITAVRRGDVVVTGGGIIGRVSRVLDDSDEVQVEIATGVKVRVARGTLSDVRSRTDPAPVAKAQPKEAKGDAGRQAGAANYYGAMGVKKSASGEQISTAYKRLEKKFGADADPDDQEAQDRLREIFQAYGVLGNPDLKERYDNLGHDKFVARYG